MKKLYSNITNIKIKGEPSELCTVVTSLDKRMEKLSNDTAKIRNILFKYLKSNAGKQYEKATTTIYILSKELYSAAEAINDLQHQVSKFVEKVNAYDLRNGDVISPRKPNIQVVNIPTNVAVMNYNKIEMNIVLKSLKEYVQNIEEMCRKIKSDKENIGRIWYDTQYRDFSMEIDNLIRFIHKSVPVLNDYIVFLGTHISKLDD